MARTKSTRSSSSRSTTPRSTGTAKSRSDRGQSKHSDVSGSEEGIVPASMSRAREFVGANANLQTAGIALAGAGILALVSTEAGRKLIKSATDAVVNLVQQNVGSH